MEVYEDKEDGLIFTLMHEHWRFFSYFFSFVCREVVLTWMQYMSNPMYLVTFYKWEPMFLQLHIQALWMTMIVRAKAPHVCLEWHVHKSYAQN